MFRMRIERSTRRAFVALLCSLGAGLACCPSAVRAYDYPYSVHTTPRGSAIDVELFNDGPAPINVVVELTATNNAGFNPAVIGSKYPHFLAPGEHRKITTAVPLKRFRAAAFGYRTRMAFGDSQLTPDPTFVYRLPFADGHRGVIRAYTGQGSRIITQENSNAVELLVPEGTPVVAARDGLVIDVRGLTGDDDSKRTSTIGNYVAVFHSDGGWANYGWLQAGSLLVKPGDQVKAGQQIALSGSNPDGIGSYIHFAIVHNFVGLNLRSVPFLMKSAGKDQFDAQTFSGPVSPNLAPRYSVPERTEPAWNPPEKLVPTPKVVDYSYDDSLTPTQRAVLYRQRIMDGNNATSDTVSGSRPLMFLLVVAIIVATFGVILAALSYSKTRPEGVRGLLWTFLRGPAPTGPFAGSQDIDSLGEAAVLHNPSAVDPDGPSKVAELPPVAVGVGIVSAHPPGGPASQLDAATPIVPEESTEVAPAAGEGVATSLPLSSPRVDLKPDAGSVGRKVQAPVRVVHTVSVMSGDRARLFAMLRQVCPSTVLCTSMVPLSTLCPAAHQDVGLDSMAHVDYVLFDSETGAVLGTILFAETDDAAVAAGVLAHRLSVLGIRSITVDKLPERQALSDAVKSFT